MKAILITLSFFTFSALVIAQEVNERKFYYLLYSNPEIQYCDIIEYKKPVFGSAYFLIDSRKVEPSRIMFYRGVTGFMANTKNLNPSGTSVFVPRILKGNINLYEREVYIRHSAPSPSGFGFTGGFSSKKIDNYYNKGFDELKKAKYKNLKLDLADNPESMVHLEKYRVANNTETGLYIASGAAILIGIVTLYNKTKDPDDSLPEPNLTGSFVSMGIGAGCSFAAMGISLSKPKHIKNAISVYNR